LFGLRTRRRNLQPVIAASGAECSGTLKIDGKEVQTIRMERSMPMLLQWDESFDIGSDTSTGVVVTCRHQEARGRASRRG